MNTLSWFIYFVGVTGALHSLVSILVVIASLAMLAGGFFCMAAAEGADEDMKEIIKKVSFGVKVAFFTIIFSITVTVFVPSRNTLILIGASEFGERIMKSESVTGIVDPSLNLLKAWIDQQTNLINEENNKRK